MAPPSTRKTSPPIEPEPAPIDREAFEALLAGLTDDSDEDYALGASMLPFYQSNVTQN